jgi:oxygen-independent coproporphyrinogen-3 oxidase
MVRELILQLKRGDLDAGYFQKKYSVDILDHWSEVWTGYEQDGLCSIDHESNRVELTRAGLLQADALLPVFFETQFQGVRYT